MEALTALRNWIEEWLALPDHQSFFLLDVQQHSNKVEVYLDGDEGIGFDTCRRLSRFLEERLDDGGPLGERYILEVSSPGATRPLRLPRQYPKHVGREVEVLLAAGGKVKGRLESVDDDGLRVKEVRGKGRKKEIVEHEIRFSEIRHSKIKLSFK